MKQKSFVKSFLISFVIFIFILTPAMLIVDKIANATPFEGESIEDALPTLYDENSPFFEAFESKNRVNILLLGVNKGMTDTIMLASFDMDTKKVSVISIPRDTYYQRTGYNGAAERKINAIYHTEEEVGVAKAVSTLLLGMPINYYAVIDYDGVENIVDAMGGIPMNIEKAMKYRDPYDKPPLVIDIPAGEQVLDGEHAVQFLRYRSGYSEGDIGRIKAHQQFITSAFKQLISFKLPKIATTIIENVDSDITIGAATKMATKATGISGEDFTTYMLPNEPRMANGASYVFPDAQETAEMLREIYSLGYAEQLLDEEGNPVFDEDGNPVYVDITDLEEVEEEKEGFFTKIKNFFTKKDDNIRDDLLLDDAYDDSGLKDPIVVD